MTPEEKTIVDTAVGAIDAAQLALTDARADLLTLEVTPPCPEPEPEPEPLPEHPELAARLSGVAPLAVFFDSGEVEEDFLELRHDWDFGDPGSGTWAHSGRSKNEARGPVAGHVYETPGTYVAKLDEQKQVTITVEDPAIVFPGEATVCFSTEGEFTGAPAGALLVTTSQLNVVAGHLAAGKRLLFRRGETWLGAGQSLGGGIAGPGIIGAFGAGEPPVILTTTTLFNPRWSDWRIMDLDVVGPGVGDTRALRTSGYCEKMLLLRCNTRGTKSGWIFSTSQLPASGPLYDQIAIVECGARDLVGGLGGNGSMFSGRRVLFLGNTYDNMEGVEHCLRMPWIQGGQVAHCDLGRPATSKHVLKLHAPPWEGTGLGNHEATRRVHIAHNIIRGGLASWPVACAPEDDHTDMRVFEVLLEGNLVIAGTKMQVAFMLTSALTLARNNVVNGTGSTPSGMTAFWITRRGLEPMPDQVTIVHNTAYTPDPDQFTLADISAGVTNCEVIGNLGSAPNSSNKTMLKGVAAAADNLLLDDAGFVSPPTDLRLLPSSAARDVVAPIGEVWDDFDGDLRALGASEAGAYEFLV